jgi:hypothetical protein
LSVPDTGSVYYQFAVVVYLVDLNFCYDDDFVPDTGPVYYHFAMVVNLVVLDDDKELLSEVFY